jgi:hypothetical protein
MMQPSSAVGGATWPLQKARGAHIRALSCVATLGKYCSIECESMAKTPDSDCLCAHTECKGNAQSVAPSPFDISS